MLGCFDFSPHFPHPRLPRAIRWKRIAPVALLGALVLMAGCHTDPNLKKQRYLESGKRYSAKHKYREAAIQYANALKIDKSFADAHYELAKSYLQLGQITAAYFELRRTVDLQPTNYPARIDLASMLLTAGKPDDAKAQADAVLSAQPNNSDAHALMSGIDFRAGKLDQALAEIRRAVELDPNRAAFHEQLALLQSGDAAKSASTEEELKRAVSLDPNSAGPRLLLTGFYVRNNRWPEAEQTARQAIAIDPKNVPAREALAQVYLRQNRQMEAENVLRQAASELSDNPLGVRILADYYERSGQLEKAKREFEAVASKHPKDLSLQEAYVRSLLTVKDYKKAQSVIAELMNKHSKDPQVLALNGIVLLNGGKVDDAVAALQSAIRDYPRDAFMQFWFGKAALAKGDLRLAEKSLRQAATLSPPGLLAEEELARVATQTGDAGLLSETAERTIASAPTFADAYVWRASVEMTRHALDKADADLNTAIKLAPSSATAYLQLGKLRLMQKKFSEGVKLLEQALQNDPDSAQALRLLVGYDLYRKHPESALSRLNQQIAKRTMNSTFYDLLAEYRIQIKDLDHALAAAEKAYEINSNDGQAVMLIANIQVQRGQTDSAIAAWERWSNAHPGDGRVFAILGMLEESKGDQDKGEEYYKRSLQIQPEQPVAANNLAYLMLKKGENVDVALTLAQTARRGMPNSPNTADTLAWAYYHKHTYAFARDLLEEAVKTDAGNQTIQYHLGMVYRELRDKANAESHLRKAISLGPNSATAKDAKGALEGLG
jgi:tetratricopeptide (TPR) repeat protein